MRKAHRPMGRIFCLLMGVAAYLAVAMGTMAAQQTNGPALTQVVDTVYRADGAAAMGTVLISWPGFTTADGKAVAAGSLSVRLGSGGAFAASLAPNTGAQPAGVYYKVVYQLAGQEPSSEYWVVPATGSISIGSVRAKLMPPTIAAQVLTRDVADTNYVHVTGDQTVSGTKTFATVDAQNINGALNAAAFPGADIGAKVNAAIAACSGNTAGQQCEVRIPQGVFSHTATMNLTAGVVLRCSGQETTTLNYTGSGTAVNFAAAGAQIHDCGLTLGGNALVGLDMAGHHGTADAVYLQGGGAGTTLIRVHSDINMLSKVREWGILGIGIQVDHATDTYLTDVNIYGVPGNTTAQTLVVDTLTGGLQVENFSGGYSGRHGLVVRNAMTDHASGGPSWLFFRNFVADCSAGGDGWLFDSSLGNAQLGATFLDSWSAGAGKDCRNNTVVTANAAGIRISGGRGIHIGGGSKIRANEGSGIAIDNANAGNIQIEDSFIYGNNNQNAGAAQGIDVAAYVDGLTITGNTVGNYYYEPGFQQYGLKISASGSQNLVIASNTFSGNTAGAILNPSLPAQYAQYGNTNSNGNSSPNSVLLGDVAAYEKGSSYPAPWMVAQRGAPAGYKFGYGWNCHWGGSGWQFDSDGANNGGACLFGDGSTGHVDLYTVPTNAPASGQSFTPAQLENYKRIHFDAAGAVQFFGNVSTLGTLTAQQATFTGTTTVAAPVNPTDAATKGYVDGAVSSGGGGGNFASPPAIGSVTPNAGTFTTLRDSDAASAAFPEIDIRAFGAVGDGQIAGPGCAISAGSHTLTCPAGTFVSGDVGKAIWVEGAGAATGCGVHVTCPLLTTISGYSSSATVTVTAAATTTLTTGYIEWGTDNTAAIQAAVDLAASPNALQHAIYVPHILGQSSGRFGCYAITGTIQLPESTMLRNKFVTLHGDGNLASAICELRLGTPIITDTFIHQAGTGTILRGLGFVGPPNYADVMGNAIECNYCIFIQVDHNWFTGWTNSINMDQVGGVTGGELIYTFNVCEESIRCIYWHGSSGHPGTTLVATNNTFDVMYNGTGYAVDLQYVTGIQEGYNTYGPNIGSGIKCDHCSSFNFGNDDFSQQEWGATAQNLYLSNSTNGVVHNNRFYSVATEAVDLAGNNASILFDGNTYGYIGATARPYMSWTATNGANAGITVTNETIDSCASPCISVASGAMANSVISRNYFAASIATPVTVTGGVPAGSCAATGSHDVCTPGSMTAQTISASGGLTVGGDLSVRDIAGHEYFVSKYASIQAAINAAYGSGTVAGKVIDDRTSAYSGAGFYIPDSVAVELAPVPYTFTGAVTHNNGNNNVVAAIVVEQGAHLAGRSTSSNHGTTIGVAPGFAGDIIATTSEGTGIGTTAQWWHWGSIENLNLSGANQTSGRCLVVENMGETSRVENILARGCYGNNIEIIGASATQSSMRNITTGRSQTASGIRFTNLAGVGKVDGLSGDCNPTALVSVQENAAGSLTILGLKAEGEASICTGTVQDPVVLLDGLAGFNDHVRILGGYAFGTAQANFAKFINAGNAIVEMDGVYTTGYTNLLSDTVRGVTVPATSSNSKQPFYYEPGGTTLANQAFTLTGGTFVQGQPATTPTEIFGLTTGSATLLAAAGNGDNSSIMTGGIQISGQNRAAYGTPPEIMARWGYRWVGAGLGYDTTNFDLVPAWNTGDTSTRSLGNPLSVCLKGSTTTSCRWPYIYSLNDNAATLTLGTSTVAALPTNYGAGTLAWVSNGASSSDCTAGGGTNRVLCYYNGNAWAALSTGGGGGVSSFNGRSGAITPQASDYSSYYLSSAGGALPSGTTIPWGQVTNQPSIPPVGMHLVAGTMVGPSSGIAGNGADQNVFSVTVPAGTFAVGTGMHCSAQWTNSASVATTYKWTLGSTQVASQSVTSASANFFTDIEIYTPSSLAAEVAWAAPIIAGTAIQAGPQVGLTASENLGNASTLKLTFNTTSGDTITPKTFHCNTIQ